MKNPIVLAAVLLSMGCASTGDDAPEPVTAPQAAAPDPRIGELQTAMTELLDRLDVMNSRLGRLEEAGASSGATGSQPVVAAPAAAPAEEPRPMAAPSAAPQPQQRALVGARLAEDYREAIMLFGRGRHADARRAFQNVFESDAAGDLADNALFWIGETYFAAGDYTNAVRHYTRVVNEYSDQNKAPDAMFKIALVQERTGDLALARRTLQQVIEKYPYSSTASTAKAELARIRF
jgi:tol-pal system protein YbgF